MTGTNTSGQANGGTPTGNGTEPTILVVEPSKFFGTLIAGICKGHGVKVRLCEEIGAALSAVAKRKPTAVLTAFELSGLSGASLIAALKSCPRHRGIPIGLMTSSDSLDRFLSAHQPDTIIRRADGFDDAVKGFLEKYEIGGEKQTRGTSASGKLQGKILLAEDMQLIQRLIGTQLHVAGAEVVIVENGAEAVAAASAETFDLILMDIEMPKMDGREAVGRIRADGITVPMIASTAHDRDSFLGEAKELGFDDVLTKPMDRQVLIKTCAKHIAHGAG